ncbi:hypothetical protein ACFQZF_02380 [Flavobacterium myungsuense]
MLISIICIAFTSCNTNDKSLALNIASSKDSESINSKILTKQTATPLDSSKNINSKYFVEQLDNTKGLSNSSVNSIFQDSENLIWIELGMD